ncbi:MAG: M23 family metallopeptidase [Bdellovibrionales bacterium]
MSDLQESRPLYAPVNYVRISSEFKRRQYHPIKKRRIAHLGIDFELPAGEPVYTAGKGVVLRKGKNRAAGRYVVVKHANNIESYYNHLESIDPKIKVGSTFGKWTTRRCHRLLRVLYKTPPALCPQKARTIFRPSRLP